MITGTGEAIRLQSQTARICCQMRKWRERGAASAIEARRATDAEGGVSESERNAQNTPSRPSETNLG